MHENQKYEEEFYVVHHFLHLFNHKYNVELVARLQSPQRATGMNERAPESENELQHNIPNKKARPENLCEFMNPKAFIFIPWRFKYFSSVKSLHRCWEETSS